MSAYCELHIRIRTPPYLLREPFAVRPGLGDRRLELNVLDEDLLLGVDEQHPARLEAALEYNVFRGDVVDADLGGHHKHVVLGDVEAGGPQPVPVEHGADVAAVGEGHECGPVPRLHHAGRPLVVVALLLLHGAVVLPRLGEHGHDRLGHRALAGHRQELEHAVGGAGVGEARLDDREQLLQLAAEDLALHHALARLHQVHVAAQSVYLAVVGEHSQRVRAFPGREGVGAEPRVHERQVGVELRVQQVGVVVPELVGGEEALVDDGLVGQRADVEAAVRPGQLVRRPLAQHEDLARELDVAHVGVAGNEEHLPRPRLALARHPADRRRVRRDVAPEEDFEADLLRQGVELILGLHVLVRVEIEDARGILPKLRQVDVRLCTATTKTRVLGECGQLESSITR